MPFNPWEIAELHVGGRILKNWTTVNVRRDFVELPSHFLFTCSETTPMANVVTDLQVKPGDPVTIMLAGQLALTGYVNIRQTMYDANSHGVAIQGRGSSQDIIDGAVELSKISGGEFRNKSLKEIADALLAPFGQSLDITGADEKVHEKFEVERIRPGESPYNAIERLARKRGLLVGETIEGRLRAMNGPEGQGGQLVEGQNIKSCRAVITDLTATNPSIKIGQAIGGPQRYADMASQIVAEGNGGATRYRPLVSVATRPVTQLDLNNALAMELQWRSAATIQAWITVYGWLDGGRTGKLWREGNWVLVKSAMAMLNRALWIKAVTFTQDDQGGTQTELELWKDPSQGAISLNN